MLRKRLLPILLLSGLCWLVLLGFAQAQTVVMPTAAGRLAVVRGQGTTLLTTGTPARSVHLVAGALVVVQGRSADGSLLYAQTETQDAGWVAVGDVLVVNPASIPVMAISGVSPLSTTAALTLTVPTLRRDLPTTDTVVLPSPILSSTQITVAVTVQESRLNLRSGPGVAYPVIDKAEPGSAWLAVGRDATGDWVLLTTATGQRAAWAATAYLTLAAPSTQLPVPSHIPPPPVQPTPAAAVILVPTATPGGANPAVAAPSAAPAGRSKTGLSGTLVFQDHLGGTIYAYNLNTDALHSLTSGIDPAISPDGHQVAFTRDGGGSGLYVINLDGSGERRLYNERDFLRSPKWSPDGRWIVFSRSSGHKDCRLLDHGVCLPDATVIESLPPDLQLPDANVQKLLKDLPNQREYRFVLSRIGVDGKDYRDIPSLDTAWAPDWNEAGIVYQSAAGIQRTADQPDARSSQVANDALHGYFHDPDWQPGGGRIVFNRKQGSHWDIYAVNPDGSGLVALAHPVTALVDELPNNVSPAWSPDGQQIVYLSNRNSVESAGAWHFWVMDADGGNQRQLPIDVILDYTFSAEQMVSWGP
ncbi:MAG: hypothetical protein U0350_23745 [Caldilineaceae bacterium]